MTAALLLASAALAPAFAEEEAAPAKGQQLPAIVVIRATEKPMVEKILATGTIRAVNEVLVQPQVEGLSIRELKADAGDRVEAGAVLATLNDDALLLSKSQLLATKAKGEAALQQIKAQLSEAQANADEARRQADRARTLSGKGTLSTAQADQLEAAAVGAEARVKSATQAVAVAEADLKVVDAQIADVDLKLARTSVTAPVSGLVSVRNAKVGAIASGAGQPLFTIEQDGALELVADVSESDILPLKAGQKAIIMLAGAAREISGSVRLVSPTIDPATRLGTVHIAIDDDNQARSGMYGSASIVTAEEKGVALPLTAITTGEEGTTVRKVENNTVKLVSVETGIQDGNMIEIRKGLKAGDEVVAKAGAYVRDGDRIQPVREEPAASN
nr:efflux RND transporter periplasmic adaptor subunit [Gellertiella hungarica]